MGYDDAAMDDAELVRAVCEGDKQAFADVYDRYSGNIYAFLCTVTRNREEAADALQDTFLAAGSRMHQLRDPSKLRPWLFAIARHNALHGISRTAKHDPLEDVEVIDSGPDPSEVAASSELAELIRDAADGLGEQERVVLGLHLEHGLQGQELADALGVTDGHAYVLMNRMRQQVERALGALLVARQGQRDCETLQTMLRPWDGRFSVLWRKRVARHVDGCEVCAALRKRLVSPVSMMAVPPLIPAPAEARDFVLDHVRLTGSAAPAGDFAGSDVGAPQARRLKSGGGGSGSKPWPAKRGGFPPPMVKPRRSGAAMALVAALVLMFFAGPTAGGSESDPQPVVSAAVPLEFPQVTESPLAQDGAIEQSPPPLPRPVDEAVSSRRRASPRPVPVAAPSSNSGVDAADEPSPDPAQSPGPAAESPSPPVEEKDEEAPSLTVRVRPQRIYASGCAAEDDPTQAQVSAAVSDDSGIAAVVLTYQQTSTTMSLSGDAYTAAIGPFNAPGTVQFQVHAEDEQGNVATRNGSVEVVCDNTTPSRSSDLQAPKPDEGLVVPQGSGEVAQPGSNAPQ